MPFYSCNVPAGSLADDMKDDLAQAITRIHAEVTGAPPDLVHVIYNETGARRQLHGRRALVGHHHHRAHPGRPLGR